MSARPSDLSVTESLRLAVGEPRSKPISPPETEVMTLFNEFRYRLSRYAMGFGLSSHDAEEIVQEVFLSLFRHLNFGRSRDNLRGWIFRVAHNLALKKRYALRDRIENKTPSECNTQIQIDPRPTPEEQMLTEQRRARLVAVMNCLPEQDQCCLRLRAEGLRYREISRILGISLGSVAGSLARSLERLARVDAR